MPQAATVVLAGDGIVKNTDGSPIVAMVDELRRAMKNQNQPIASCGVSIALGPTSGRGKAARNLARARDQCTLE